MRIHTNSAVTYSVIHEAAKAANATLESSDIKGSRSHDQAWEIALTGESRRRPNFGKNSDSYAATWDQWGVFLAAIFAVDSEAKCWAYENRDDFDWKTGDRFDGNSFPADYHGDHKFDFVGILVTNVSLQRCRKCSATKRWQNNH